MRKSGNCRVWRTSQEPRSLPLLPRPTPLAPCNAQWWNAVREDARACVMLLHWLAKNLRETEGMRGKGRANEEADVLRIMFAILFLLPRALSQSLLCFSSRFSLFRALSLSLSHPLPLPLPLSTLSSHRFVLLFQEESALYSCNACRLLICARVLHFTWL
jgi:hypothetical protein